jgi:pyridoxine 4-dehydrogenase
MPRSAGISYGAIRLPGKDAWGEPDDPDHAREVLRRAVDLGI